ncbi:unnamed protein product [Lota lota]
MLLVSGVRSPVFAGQCLLSGGVMRDVAGDSDELMFVILLTHFSTDCNSQCNTGLISTVKDRLGRSETAGGCSSVRLPACPWLPAPVKVSAKLSYSELLLAHR